MPPRGQNMTTKKGQIGTFEAMADEFFPEPEVPVQTPEEVQAALDQERMERAAAVEPWLSEKGKWRAFLRVYTEVGVISRACAISKLSRSAVYERRDADVEFAMRLERAKEIAAENLEGEAIRRAYEGTIKPVFYKGETAGYIREYSDTLLIFLLKASDPAKYGDQVTQKIIKSDATANDDEEAILIAADEINRRRSSGSP